MTALEFWKAVTVDQSHFLEELTSCLAEAGIRYCVIGGQAVNAYVEPLVSLNLDLVVAVDQIDAAESLLRSRFEVARFPDSLNVSSAGSKLRVQVQTDPRYFPYVDRAAPREVLGAKLPVAAVEDVLQGKVWAAGDDDRRPSKRRKDLLDIERLLEAYPALRTRVPADLLRRLDA